MLHVLTTVYGEHSTITNMPSGPEDLPSDTDPQVFEEAVEKLLQEVRLICNVLIKDNFVSTDRS